MLSADLETADLLLFLVSADLIGSDHVWNVELKRAMERHESGSACVIPVLVRPCVWTGAPFAELQPLPEGAKPVSLWDNHDEAWTQVVDRIQKLIPEMPTRPDDPASDTRSPSADPVPPPPNRPEKAAAGAPPQLSPRTPLDVADTLRRAARGARIPMENVAVHLDMDLAHLADDDWHGLVKAVHAGVHGTIGDGRSAVLALVGAARTLLPGNTELTALAARLLSTAG